MDTMTKNTLSIVYSTNEGYLMPTITSMISILKNNSASNFDFYILHSDMDESCLTQKMTDSLRKYTGSFRIIPTKIDAGIFSSVPTHGRSKEAYYRLLIPYVLPKTVERCLYLDGDTIVNKPIHDLYTTEFDGHSMIVSRDMGEAMFYSKHMHEILNIPKHFDYFNSGVILFNMNYFRTQVDMNRIINYIKNNSEKLKFLDQDVLNALFFDTVKYTDGTSYNYIEILVNPLITNDGINTAHIIHFIQKPWKINYTGVNARYWWQYAKENNHLAYIRFIILNTLYRKTLAFVTIFIPLSAFKRLKNTYKSIEM